MRDHAKNNLTVAVIHGSPRKGNTYEAARILMDEMRKYGEISAVEFIMPRDVPEFCTACYACFDKGYGSCPHSEYTLPIIEAMRGADALILTSPVFVLQATAGMKNFLDHCAHLFVVHSPLEEMFSKRAAIISTTAGAGTRQAIKTMATSARFWGVNRVYKVGAALRSGSLEGMNPARRRRFEARLKKTGAKLYKEAASGRKRRPYFFTWIMFHASRKLMRISERADSADARYWREKGWFKKTPFQREPC